MKEREKWKNQRFHRADSRIRFQRCQEVTVHGYANIAKYCLKADWNTKCPFHISAYIYSNFIGYFNQLLHQNIVL